MHALTIHAGFTKANSTANYYFWLSNLEPTIQETEENQQNSPQNGCSSYEFSDVKFAYPLAPNNRVLKEIEPGSFVAFVGASGMMPSSSGDLLLLFRSSGC